MRLRGGCGCGAGVVCRCRARSKRRAVAPSAILAAMPKGRPFADEAKRDVKIEFLAMASQRDAYDAAAEAAGMKRAEWIRERLDAAAERETR